MMVVVLYAALMVYAAGLFVYAVTHDRPWAALGILLSVSGFQLALQDALVDHIAIGVALSGLAMVGRDVVGAMLPRLSLAVSREQAR